MKCPYCGAENKGNVCEYCGAKLVKKSDISDANVKGEYNANSYVSSHPERTAPQDYYYEDNSYNALASRKNKWITLLLCIFLGYFGVHYFYVGKIGKGILYLFTAGIFGIGILYDIYLILTGKFTDKNGLPLIQ